MCMHLMVPPYATKLVMSCFEHLVVQHAAALLRSRHADHAILCSIYAVCKLLGPQVYILVCSSAP